MSDGVLRIEKHGIAVTLKVSFESGELRNHDRWKDRAARTRS